MEDRSRGRRGGDSHAAPLVVVPIAIAPELQRLAKECKYGSAELFGDDLAAASKDRIARAKKLAKQQARAATEPQPTWEVFARGGEDWSIIVHETAFDTGYEAPGVKHHAFHMFSDAKTARPRAQRLIAEWEAGGFVRLTAAQAEARPSQEGAYLGWTGPLPEDGHYFIERIKRGKKWFETDTVRFIAIRGDEIVTTGGTIGKNFGELEQHFYGDRRHAVSLATYTDDTNAYAPIDRATLIARYEKARPKKR